MRVGITLLPELGWSTDRERWRAVEAYGYDHAWTFDHLAWRSLADSPWFATVPTLTAAALSTSTLRVGTWVATPNFRHPVPFAKELMTLDHLSDGRLNVGLGAGTDGYDATMLGEPALSPGRRHARFAEFVEVLGSVLSQPRTSWSGDWYTVDEARTVPACVQRPHPPFVVAANGPKGMRLALEQGDGWVTTTGAPPDADAEDWWAAAADKAARFARATEDRTAAGPPLPEGFTRYLNLEARTADFGSAEQVVDALGRAAALGYTDAVLAWPRPDGPMAGDPALVEAVAARLPEVRTF
ncbi:LLM class flavin-dependent oxidoreductase [Microlunatus antarcticus]|uniref:Alkanesulfonate monooxygenase SsuD/methylene tetrahydromethanopterin reductase-like flavin-dependent oxidoreductase (Luciferase family) n=1 Tax=Microlunatus antarcticus TaxID=53388 RepID=A0A7W5JWH4_9ACTN|nr:LLM class flavin-dependent oxidoreductase [Microlunatus antarcticus]MBB3327598.1 alkanesulfonate monooxygenase SsuD/methylene tetrahydromethanopterin reductase-like flavin-dependent oxidoreductase (luciferase family) [Microlunatus antarcticus]